MNHTKISGVALLLASIALPAFAAPPPVGAPAAQTAPMPGDSTPGTAPALPKAMATKLDQHIVKLHGELAITPAEEPQWNAFAGVMRDNAAAMRQVIEDRGGKLGTMNAADNMQSYAELAKVHADNMQKLAASFETLYRSLSDEQKQVADTVFRNEQAKHEASHKHTG
jgi:hypothetical protein